KVMKATEVGNMNTVTNATTQATETTAYVKPAIEVIEMEMEGAILTGSGTSGNDYNDGGRY
ncbi:MAG: hypothetical protein RR304_09975, partial [Bacteroides sp.]